MSRRLENKVALITGAGSGLGAATATRFAEEGAHVFVTDINLDSVANVAATINTAAGGGATARRQDVTDEADWDVLMEEIIAARGRLDILVNNAGIVITGTVESTSLSEWRKTQTVNLEAVFMGTRAGVAAMKVSGGSIINISSIEGIIGEALTAAYNASKGGVRIFTKSAALHCAHEGYDIRVNSVHPGYILTPMVTDSIGTLAPEVAAEMHANLIREIPLKTMGEPLDIANGCLFLASAESKYMTGSELVIDGGYTCR
ncbi:MAG: glucose 1-dehydrogenase [Halioglobus sp.]|nr:glucose 1-dehydrogenase [Halioglobus sp.]